VGVEVVPALPSAQPQLIEVWRPADPQRLLLRLAKPWLFVRSGELTNLARRSLEDLLQREGGLRNRILQQSRVIVLAVQERRGRWELVVCVFIFFRRLEVALRRAENR